MKLYAEAHFLVHGLKIVAAYHPAFPKFVKSTVPPKGWTYDPKARTWFVQAEYAEAVYYGLKSFYSVMDVDDRSFLDKKDRWDKRREAQEFNARNDRRGEEWRQQQQRTYNYSRTRGSSGRQYHGYSSEGGSQSNGRSRPTRSRISRTEAFGILGIPDTSDAGAIKKAWRSLAIQFHPDKNRSGDTTEKMKQINEAYDLLKT